MPRSPSLPPRLVLDVACIGFLALSGCTAATQHIREPFLPVDEASAVPALFATRAALLDALRRSDAEAIGRWLADEFNGTAVERRFTIEALGKGGEMAAGLSDALSHGGTFTNPTRKEFCGPYWASRPPDLSKLPDHLVFEGSPWVVIVPASPVRARPSADAPIVGTLSLELVNVLPSEPTDPDGRFVQLRFAGRDAFVARADVRDPDDLRMACFQLIGERWALTTFK
jgi:hypothetical protein